MTESEWLEATDPAPMLEFMREKASDRKFRLFATACGRRVAEWMDEGLRQALDVTEQYADGVVGWRVLAVARRTAYEATRVNALVPGVAGLHYPVASHAANVVLYAASAPDKYEMSELARITSDTAGSLWWHVHRGTADADEKRVQSQLLRDVLRYSLHPVALDSSWLTSTVRALAEGIYSDRAFDRMPILADALQDAGSDSHELLSHLRSDGPHCKGCWALDLMLGKS